MRHEVLVVALAIAAACAPAASSAPHADDAHDPDARFFDDAPCPAPPAGITLEETADFAPFDEPAPLVVLMGGSTEVDGAAIRFAEAARGGDLLVLRATGSVSSYTAWFAEELPLEAPLRAVATARVDDASVAADDSLLCRVARADALWLAGGDQSDYLLRWPAALHEAIARAVARGLAIGGTSAGAMSLSELSFDAALGSIDSSEALEAPLSDRVSLSRSPFSPPATAALLVDTHFSARDRLGRLIAFLARAAHDGESVVGLGIDEETAVVIDGADVSVSGAGDAWLVALDGAVTVTDAPLDASARVARLSAQAGWPPVIDADTSGVVLFDVVGGALPVPR